MNDPKPAARTLKEASILLDGHLVLKPNTVPFEHYYVPRPHRHVETKVFREAERAKRARRPFHWFFTGHTGAGKSTELARITAEQEIRLNYIPVVVDLEAEFDVHNLQYTDLILAMGKGCAAAAHDNNVEVPRELRKRIEEWGWEITREKETVSSTQGQAGLKIPFFTLAEEVRSGGTKRELIRQKISTDVRGFIKMVNDLAAAVFDFTGLDLLCVLDGLDHVGADPCLRLLADHYETITEPAISKIIVIPLPLLNTSFLATVGHQHSSIPNIKVFRAPGDDGLDPGGFEFYEQVIGRYVSLDLIAPEARRSLFRLSAGILRDMIRNTGDACGYALDAGASIVGEEHAERVWDEMVRFYRSQLLKENYEVLRYVDKNPYIQGIDGVPPLLHSKAVVFYPNGEGWHGVHPAVRRLLGEPSE